MLAIYEIHKGYDGLWAPIEPDRRFELLFASGDGEWTVPAVEWHLTMVEKLDVAGFESSLAFGPAIDAGTRSILERTCDLLPLGGEATDWVVLRPHERIELVDESKSGRRTESPVEYERRAANYLKHGIEVPPPKIVKYRLFEDRLVPNTVARVKGFNSLVAIEDESESSDVEDPERCGFRAWVKHRAVTGVVFKKIWDSTDTVDYDPGWFYDTLGNPSYEWD